MPTVLYISGWRLFFYSNEGLDSIHIHAQKGDMECKFWILSEEVDIDEAFAYNFSTSGRKEIRKILFKNFDLIVDSWTTYFKK
ncbi:uncharacterized protein DUF4160 [Algoriphagus ratkowskyi]|uniref:DUF4160 domain-containing protein n=1 Tax=Algoriphagus ratkowskyi TaxID=57028 RepID=A0A2W7RWK2_9BACT|nr:DUF4160 domain-containing protein [Algoriphagus ratkowskyi]PZX59577.1 uncharacterized protein DUF4160 [Algoriphagus ratkowskyi]TXD78698.1 DUF4160 domain-containing protein [Algoriphagus ratkowskyi]